MKYYQKYTPLCKTNPYLFQPAASHHSALAAAAAAMKAHEMPPGSYHHHPHPAAVGIGHHQLMDMYSGMTPATAINTMDWKNTSQVGKTQNQR